MKRRDLLKLLGFGAAAAAAPAAAIAATRTAPAAAPATPPVPPAPPAAGPTPITCGRHWQAGKDLENDQFNALLELCEKFQELKHQDPTKYGVSPVLSTRINNLKQQIETKATKLGLKTTWNEHYAYFTAIAAAPAPAETPDNFWHPGPLPNAFRTTNLSSTTVFSTRVLSPNNPTPPPQSLFDLCEEYAELMQNNPITQQLQLKNLRWGIEREAHALGYQVHWYEHYAHFTGCDPTEKSPPKPTFQETLKISNRLHNGLKRYDYYLKQANRPPRTDKSMFDNPSFWRKVTNIAKPSIENDAQALGYKVTWINDQPHFSKGTT